MDKDYQFWMDIRQALLMVVDVIESKTDTRPRTSKLRKFYKGWKK